MLRRWQGIYATGLVIIVTVGLVAMDLTDPPFRRWWAVRALTTDTVAGVLVLLVTVLVVNQLLSRRDSRDRSRVVAAQAAIVLAQAVRSVQALSAAPNSAQERETAGDEVRSYLTMLLIAAPVLIDSEVPRAFLEQAQRLAAELGREVAAMKQGPSAVPAASAAVDRALARTRTAAAPLLEVLSIQQRDAASGLESA